MSIVMGIALYFIIWWMVLFAVLPFGVRTQGEAGEITQGTPESAPAAAPRVRWTVAVTTGVAAVVFAMVWLALRFRLVPLDLGGVG
jgi:predicted secreted protein